MGMGKHMGQLWIEYANRAEEGGAARWASDARIDANLGLCHVHPRAGRHNRLSLPTGEPIAGAVAVSSVSVAAADAEASQVCVSVRWWANLVVAAVGGGGFAEAFPPCSVVRSADYVLAQRI